MRLKSVIANHIIHNKKLSQTSGPDEFVINNITYIHEQILFIFNAFDAFAFNKSENTI